MAKMMEKLKLQVNQQKTRICHVPEESFDFLGYTLGRCYRIKTGQAYIGTKPSKKRVFRPCESISQKTQREANGRDTEELIGELNLMLKGWANYFRLPSLHYLLQPLCAAARVTRRTVAEIDKLPRRPFPCLTKLKITPSLSHSIN
jgi:hypothetical protein